jgi:HJR/Mrr/RecB family endonuclease
MSNLIWVLFLLILVLAIILLYVRYSSNDDYGDWEVDDIRRLSPYQFEQLVGKYYKKKGYRVKVSTGSGDKGVDVHAKSSSEYIVVQVKKYHKDLGCSVVQRTSGACLEFDADKAVVVTSSGFSDSAIESEEKIDLVELVDINDFLRKLNRVGINPDKIDSVLS